MWRWLSADPREVVDLAGAGTLADVAEERHLGEELRRWRGIVARRRLVALARRHAAVALGLAALLEVLALLDAIPPWVVVAVPLVYFVVAVVAFALQGPSPFALARLLDDKLGLNDRLATALEIEARGGQESPLERRTVADAAGLLAAGREDWRASAARAGRDDWSVLGGVVLALAVVVAIALATGGSSSSSTSIQALGPNGGAGAPGAAAERRKKREEEKRGSHKEAAPTGKLHKVEGKKRAEISPVETQNQGYQQIPQGKSAGRKGKAATGKGSGQAGKNGATAGKAKQGANTPNGKQSSPDDGKGPSTESNKEKEHPTVGFSVKGQKKHKGSGREGSSEVSGAGAKKSSPNGQQDETTASSQAAPKGGTPTGAGKAGGEQGNSRQGHAAQIKGQASQAVKIQPGYAPSRSSKGGKERRKAPGDEEGAGGKARTAQVTGATQVGEEFSFVPAAGGAVPGASVGLQQNYLESLKWVARLPW